MADVINTYSVAGTGDISDLLSEAMRQTPNASADYDQGTIELWAIEDTRSNEQITNCLKNSFIYLADGHHRYETSYEDALAIKIFFFQFFNVYMSNFFIAFWYKNYS